MTPILRKCPLLANMKLLVHITTCREHCNEAPPAAFNADESRWWLDYYSCRELLLRPPLCLCCTGTCGQDTIKKSMQYQIWYEKYTTSYIIWLFDMDSEIRWITTHLSTAIILPTQKWCCNILYNMKHEYCNKAMTLRTLCYSLSLSTVMNFDFIFIW